MTSRQAGLGTAGRSDDDRPVSATSYLRNTLAPDGSPLVKDDIERYILGHSKKGSHAGYGRQWFATLKSAVEVTPDPFA
jgi:hypothetical protein